MIKRRRTILDLCGGTGSWSDPYRELGYDVYVVDKDPLLRPQFFLSAEQFLAHLKRGTVVLPPLAGILAAPPCTVFSNASSQYWTRYDEDGRTRDAVTTVRACLSIIEILQPRWWALENPPGRLRKFIGPPSWSFVACDYGEPWIKKTLIWGTAEKPEPTQVVDPKAISMIARRGGASDNTKRLRSTTPPGFAKAFADRNR